MYGFLAAGQCVPGLVIWLYRFTQPADDGLQLQTSATKDLSFLPAPLQSAEYSTSGDM